MKETLKDIATWGLVIAIIAGGIGLVSFALSTRQRRDCIAQAEALEWNYHWDGQLGCRVEINGHWWTIDGVTIAPAP